MRRVICTLIVLTLTSAGSSFTSPAEARTTAATLVSPVAGTFSALAPARLLDTRISDGAPTPTASGTIHLPVAGRGGVPTSGASAVVLNVTAVAPPASGYLTVYADASGRPATSNLNFAKGVTVANQVVAPIGADGKVAIYNGSAGRTNVVADVAGFYAGGNASEAGAFIAVTPARLMDTRSGLGAPSAGANKSAVLQVLGRDGVPSDGVSAVVLNVTAVKPAASGYVTVYGDGSARPTTSNLNFSAGQVVPNSVVTPVGSDGKVDFYNGSAGATNLLADVSGYFLAGTPTVPGAFVSLTPARLMDTRTSLGSAAPAANGTVHLVAAGRGGIPSNGAGALQLNVTAVAPPAGGYATVYGDVAARPNTSNLNYRKGRTVPNAVVAPLGTKGSVAFFNGSSATTNLVADVSGYYIAKPSLGWSQPTPVMPAQGGLTSVSCPTTTFCAAVDETGNALMYDGSSWSAPRKIDNLAAPSQVSCSSATFCAAVDDAANALTFDGTSWSTPDSIETSPGDAYLEGVSCVGTDFCVAVDDSGYAITHSAGGWSVRHAVAGVDGFGAVSCVSVSYCLAVDGYGDHSVTYNGSVWSAAKTTPVEGRLLSCASATFCVASDGELASVYNGSSWGAKVTADSNNDITSLSCAPGTTTCVALDYDGYAVMYAAGHWSSRVRVVTSEYDGRPGVSCAATTFCVGVADRAYVYDGTSWSSGTAIDPFNGSIESLSCKSSTFCLAVSPYAQVSTYDGLGWSTPLSLASGTLEDPIASGSCTSPTFCLVVDASGHYYTYDGTSWSAANSSGSYQIYRVSCVSATFCLGIANDSDVVRWNGTSWALMKDLGNVSLAGISCVSTTFCMAVNRGGADVWNGTTWTSSPAFDDLYLVQAGSCGSSALCVLVANDGKEVTYRNGKWSSPLTLGTFRLLDVSCTSDNHCTALYEPNGGLGSSGIVVFDGVTWSKPAMIDPSPSLSTVSCVSAEFCIAGDDQGRTIVGSSAS